MRGQGELEPIGGEDPARREQASVVHEHVDRGEPRLVDPAPDGGEVGHVDHGQLHPSIAGGAADLVARRLTANRVATEQLDRRATRRQRLRRGSPEASVAAGHQTEAPRQVDVELARTERAAVPGEADAVERADHRSHLRQHPAPPPAVSVQTSGQTTSTPRSHTICAAIGVTSDRVARRRPPQAAPQANAQPTSRELPSVSVAAA